MVTGIAEITEEAEARNRFFGRRANSRVSRGGGGGGGTETFPRGTALANGANIVCNANGSYEVPAGQVMQAPVQVVQPQQIGAIPTPIIDKASALVEAESRLDQISNQLNQARAEVEKARVEMNRTAQHDALDIKHQIADLNSKLQTLLSLTGEE